jgi:hypothetical protein
MPEPWCRGISPAKEKRIKLAVESTCELCREYVPLSLLELHGFPADRVPKRISPKEKERHIIVVCHACHQHIHDLPVPDEKLAFLIAKRPFSVRKEIHRILGYVPKPYSPPNNIDLSQIYEESFHICPPLDSYRLSG